MGAVFGGGVRPSVMHKGHNGEPCIPVILPCQCVEMDVLFNPLVFVFCESISLWVESSANVSPYA